MGRGGLPDALCTCIDETVSHAHREPEQITIEFSNGTVFTISLREEDFEGPEAGTWTFQVGKDVTMWMVWRDD
jgi:hypothetical protein